MIHDEDVASCRAMGAFGAEVVPADARILTHCNAGALATAGYGTALGVIRGAVEAGKKRVAVFADETRPFLQGARLTAWELVRDGIDTTIITDNMSGALMRQGKVDLVVVGADRIAANGDTANKIGTYGVAVLAREHNIPFYVAAPLSTIDLRTPDGAHIPIEERNAREVTHVGGVAGRAGRREDLEPGVRRDAAPVHRRHHHRARHLPGAVHRVAEERVRGEGARVGHEAHETPVRGIAFVWRSDPRHRNLLRRDVGRRRRRDRRRGEAVGDPLERRRLAGGDPSRVGRRRAGARLAPAHPRHLRRRRARAGRGGIDLARPRRRRGHAGARPRRLAARRRVVREGGRRGGRPAAGRRPPPRGPHRVARAAERRAAAAVGRPRRLRRPHQPVSRRAARSRISC